MGMVNKITFQDYRNIIVYISMDSDQLSKLDFCVNR